MHEDDISHLLQGWPMQDGQVTARRITGRDGRPRIQVRIDLGLLQMEYTGRPDGARPDDCESLLDAIEQQRDRYREANGTLTGYVITSEDCRRLRQEVVQYYHRYVALFALQDFERVIEDTEHNLRILDLCREHGQSEHDRQILEQFRPQIIITRARALAEHAVARHQPDTALRVLDAALEELTAIYGEPEAQLAQRSNEIQLLRAMRDELVPRLPASQRAELEERLQAALDAENFELAAILRDELRMLGFR